MGTMTSWSPSLKTTSSVRTDAWTFSGRCWSTSSRAMMAARTPSSAETPYPSTMAATSSGSASSEEVSTSTGLTGSPAGSLAAGAGAGLAALPSSDGLQAARATAMAASRAGVRSFMAVLNGRDYYNR